MKSLKGRRPTGLYHTVAIKMTVDMRAQIEKYLIRQANKEGRISSLGEFVRTAIKEALRISEQ